MAKKDKIIAWILIIQGVGGLAFTGWHLAGSQISTGTATLSFILAITALAAGIGSFNQRKWAMISGIIIFAAQTLILTTPTFTFYILVPFHFDVKITLTKYAFGVNVIGLCLLIWSVVRYKASNLSFKPVGVTGASN